MSQPPTAPPTFTPQTAKALALDDAAADEGNTLGAPHFDRDDAISLLSHIEGHVFAAKVAVSDGDATKLRAQAVEIAAWGRSLISIADAERIGVADARVLYRCAGKSCPGLPYRASDSPHPVSCAAEVVDEPANAQPLPQSPDEQRVLRAKMLRAAGEVAEIEFVRVTAKYTKPGSTRGELLGLDADILAGQIAAFPIAPAVALLLVKRDEGTSVNIVDLAAKCGMRLDELGPDALLVFRARCTAIDGVEYNPSTITWFALRKDGGQRNVLLRAAGLGAVEEFVRVMHRLAPDGGAADCPAAPIDVDALVVQIAAFPITPVVHRLAGAAVPLTFKQLAEACELDWPTLRVEEIVAFEARVMALPGILRHGDDDRPRLGDTFTVRPWPPVCSPDSDAMKALAKVGAWGVNEFCRVVECFKETPALSDVEALVDQIAAHPIAPAVLLLRFHRDHGGRAVDVEELASACGVMWTGHTRVLGSSIQTGEVARRSFAMRVESIRGIKYLGNGEAPWTYAIGPESWLKAAAS